MTARMKAIVRDALPRSLQVPLKYWVNRCAGMLEPEMALLPYLVRRGDRVVDVGGNRGVYAYGLRRLGARVEVFEPNPACSGVLDAWARRRSGVAIHPVGLSDRAGSTVLRIPIDAAGVEHDASASLEPHAFADAHERSVELRTLDGFGWRDLRFIKIDVEGHESGVLMGARATLAHSKPSLLVEIEQRHLQRPIGDVFAALADMGYRGWFLDGRILRDIAAFDLARDQGEAAFAAGRGRYINNFLFLSPERMGEAGCQRMLQAFGAAP